MLHFGHALGDHRRVDQQIEASIGHVDLDDVAVSNRNDRTVVDGLRGNMADAEAPRAAGKASVGDERAVRSPTCAFQGTGDGEHLAHSRPTLGTFVADHENGARLDLAGEDGIHRRVLPLEHPRRALEEQLLLRQPGNLHDNALGSE